MSSSRLGRDGDEQAVGTLVIVERAGLPQAQTQRDALANESPESFRRQALGLLRHRIVLFLTPKIELCKKRWVSRSRRRGQNQGYLDKKRSEGQSGAPLPVV